jgi:signal transduction histidine kinase
MRLARRRFAGILSERLRLARELHDNLEQELAALGIQAVMIRDNVAPDGGARRHLDVLSGILERCTAGVRAAVWDLRSGHDLAGALRAVAERLSADRPVAITVQVDGAPTSVPEDVERQLLRIGQEAVTNAVRHGAPAHIHISLEIRPRHARLRVRDDGCGFDPAISKEGHFGLTGMRERAREVKGELHIASKTGVGTEVMVEVPLK